MSFAAKLLEGLGWAIVMTVLGLLFTGLNELIVLCLAFGGVFSTAVIVRLLRGLTISGWFLLNLGTFLAGVALLVWGMWSIVNFEFNGGIGSYEWYLAQVNVFVGMFSLGMPLVLRSGARTL